MSTDLHTASRVLTTVVYHGCSYIYILSYYKLIFFSLALIATYI